MQLRPYLEERFVISIYFKAWLMKKVIALTAVLFVIAPFANAQDGSGWREKEMEIKVSIQNKNDAYILQELHLNGEPHATYCLMDVVPEELEKIKSSGLIYEIVTDNLNEFYKDFWLKKKPSYQPGRKISLLR